jgi:hypothetical protein
VRWRKNTLGNDARLLRAPSSCVTSVLEEDVPGLAVFAAVFTLGLLAQALVSPSTESHGKCRKHGAICAIPSTPSRVVAHGISLPRH